MNILALEPYYGGSHKAFIDGLSSVSTHDWTLLTLPAYKWKWRMRHAAVTFAQQAAKLLEEGRRWDMIFCCDMLNLAEFLGIAPKAISDLPSVVYFHENQLTYPVRFESERDYQFAMTNMTTALAAEKVWFNSAFHRDSFLGALGKFLAKMPDFQPVDAVKTIRAKSSVHSPGVNDIAASGKDHAGPVRILWAARWEHDKNPDDFFAALKILKEKSIDFRLSVIGEQFRNCPEVFDWAKEYFADHIEKWGWQKSRTEYEEVLKWADVFVSTADHEFFGLSAIESCMAGAYPVLPERLSYPEILGLGQEEGSEEFFFDGTVKALADKLEKLSQSLPLRAGKAAELASRYKWQNVVSIYDQALMPKGL